MDQKPILLIAAILYRIAMEEYCLNPKVVYDILRAKGVEYLFYADTVLTSLTFIERNALLSRAFIESYDLTQTPQKSDEEDKNMEFGMTCSLMALTCIRSTIGRILMGRSYS